MQYEHLNVGSSAQACLDRAKQYWEWCENDKNHPVFVNHAPSGESSSFPPDDDFQELNTLGAADIAGGDTSADVEDPLVAGDPKDVQHPALHQQSAASNHDNAPPPSSEELRDGGIHGAESDHVGGRSTWAVLLGSMVALLVLLRSPSSSLLTAPVLSAAAAQSS